MPRRALAGPGDPGLLPSASGDPCDICGSAGAMVPDLEVSLAGALAVWICRCRECGFRQVRPRLQPALLPALYASDYFDATVPVGYTGYARQARRRRREAWFLNRWLRRHAPPGPILEVGCALGFLLAALRDAGHEVVGVDVSRFAAYYARTTLGLDVRPATLEGAGFPDATFACAVQKDVLEHVVDPRQHLAETRRVLRPGGWLWIVTPNGEANLRPLRALARQAAGDTARLPLLDQAHLSFFSAHHLRRLFDECGFDVVSARSIGLRRALRALGWLPGQARFARLVPRTPPGRPVPHDADAAARFDQVARQIERDIARDPRRVRDSAASYRLHRALKVLDEVPGAHPLAYDFQFLLRAR